MYIKGLIIIIILTSIILGINYYNNSTSRENNISIIDNTLDETSLNKSNNIVEFDNNLDKLLSEKNVLLFFTASWCPTCKALKNDIEKNLGLIPDDLYIVNIDYDKEIEMRKNYGILVQHTLVFIDENKNEIIRKVGVTKLESLIDEYNILINEGKLEHIISSTILEDI